MSNEGCGPPAAYVSAGQNRDESGVSASSASTSLPVAVDAELELRVGDDDPALGGVGRAELVERDRQSLELAEALLADELDRAGGVDVLVVALDGFRRGREDRRRQPLRLARGRA